MCLLKQQMTAKFVVQKRNVAPLALRMKQKREVRLNELHDQFLCQVFFVTNFHSQINVVVIVVCHCFVEWIGEEAAEAWQL
jgi:hypothetical protein